MLVNQALDIVNKSSEAFIDLDTPPEENAPLDQIVKFIFSGRAVSIEEALKNEAVEAGDLVLREAARRTYKAIQQQAVLRPPLGLPGPTIPLPPPPVLVPDKGVRELETVVNTVFPALELSDEIYAQGLLELILNSLSLE